MIMKQLDHPNIVKLIEVIDDPGSDNYYMGILSVFGSPVAFYKPLLLHGNHVDYFNLEFATFFHFI